MGLPLAPNLSSPSHIQIFPRAITTTCYRQIIIKLLSLFRIRCLHLCPCLHRRPGPCHHHKNAEPSFFHCSSLALPSSSLSFYLSLVSTPSFSLWYFFPLSGDNPGTVNINTFISTPFVFSPRGGRGYRSNPTSAQKYSPNP